MVFDAAWNVTVKVQVASIMEEIAAAGRVIAGVQEGKMEIAAAGIVTAKFGWNLHVVSHMVN